MKLSMRKVMFGLSVVTTLAIVAQLFLTLNRRYFFHEMGYDEGFFVWGGWSINRGLTPYKDFLEFKPPFVFLTHALALKLFGFGGQRYRIFFAAFPLLGLLSLQIMLIARKVQPWLVCGAMVALTTVFMHYPFHDTALSDSESIGFSYYLLGASVLLWPTQKRWPIAVGCALLTACALSKEPFLFVVLSTWLGALVLRHKEQAGANTGPTLKDAWQYFKMTLVGCTAVVGSLLLWLGPTGGLRAYAEMAHNYSRIYRDPKLSYCVVLGIFQPSTPMAEFKVQFGKILDSFLNPEILSAVAPFLLAGWVLSSRRSWLLFFTTITAFVGGLWAVTASNCQWDHYYTMALSGVVFVTIVGLDALKRPLAFAPKAVAHWVSLSLLALACFKVGPLYLKEREAVYQYPPHHEPLPGAFALIKSTTTPSDRIFTSGPPHLYVLMDRVSAVREGNIIDEIMGIYDGETDEERLSGVRAELEKNMPKVVVLDPEHGHRKVRHYRALVMPFLKAHDYTEVSPGLYVRK